MATYRNNLGSAWKAKGDYDKAITFHEKALASDLNTFGEDHPNVSIRRNNLGKAWYAKSDYDKAIVYFEQALEIFKKVFGSDYVSTKAVSNYLNQAKQRKRCTENK